MNLLMLPGFGLKALNEICTILKRSRVPLGKSMKEWDEGTNEIKNEIQKTAYMNAKLSRLTKKIAASLQGGLRKSVRELATELNEDRSQILAAIKRNPGRFCIEKDEKVACSKNRIP